MDEVEEVSLSEEDRTYILDKFHKTEEVLPQIDEKLTVSSTGWKLSRMNKVDLAILRLGTYEALYDEDIPVGVALNEAVELAKKYGGDDSSSFVNGVLAKVVK